jgi:hypothetical protein
MMILDFAGVFLAEMIPDPDFTIWTTWPIAFNPSSSLMASILPQLRGSRQSRKCERFCTLSVILRSQRRAAPCPHRYRFADDLPAPMNRLSDSIIHCIHSKPNGYQSRQTRRSGHLREGYRGTPLTGNLFLRAFDLMSQMGHACRSDLVACRSLLNDGRRPRMLGHCWCRLGQRHL